MSATSLGIPLVFFALAGWFFLGPTREPYPRPPETAPLPAEALSTAPRRLMMSDPPGVGEGAYRLRCQECHKLFPSNRKVRDRLAQHEHIRLDHGRNSWCFNCHAIENRNKLVLQEDQEVGYERVAELCAKCHGTLYRDWELGMHGRTDGFWDATAGDPLQRSCTECHDPHRPAFPPYEPLPGPNTLRMGTPPSEPAHDDHKRSPLMQWQRDTEHAPESDHSPEGQQ